VQKVIIILLIRRILSFKVKELRIREDLLLTLFS